MNKRHLLYFAVLSLTLASCSSDSSDAPADCNEDQKEYMGKCYSLVDCVPGCNEETEKCVNGTCYDNAECVPQCNSEYSKCVNGRCLSKDVCVPSCNAETEQCYKGECYDSRLCLPECEIYTQKCADGKCIGLDECYPKCTDGLICNKGKCETPDPTLCEGTLCKNDTTYCDEPAIGRLAPKATAATWGIALKASLRNAKTKPVARIRPKNATAAPGFRADRLKHVRTANASFLLTSHAIREHAAPTTPIAVMRKGSTNRASWGRLVTKVFARMSLTRKKPCSGSCVKLTRSVPMAFVSSSFRHPERCLRTISD